MASNYHKIYTTSGGSYIAKRAAKQGRRPSGLAPAQLVRLYADDKIRLAQAAEKLGYLYNENEIIRSAVKLYLDNSVCTELLIPSSAASWLSEKTKKGDRHEHVNY